MRIRLSAMNLIESILFVLLCCCCITVNGRCWIECPESERGLSDPQCFLKDNGTSTSCSKAISNSDFTGQSITGYTRISLYVYLSDSILSLRISNGIGDKLNLRASEYQNQITYLRIDTSRYLHFTSIQPELFYLLPNLKRLQIISVKFQYFPHFTQSNRFLTNLFIFSISIENAFDATLRTGRLSHLSGLKLLYLRFDKTTNVTDLSFSGLTALFALWLVHIHIPNPIATFSPLVRLRSLEYTSSGLTDISFLKQTPSLYGLHSLSFSSNSITSIQSNTFSNYRYLTLLNLNFNKISRFEKESFNKSKLIWLYLHSNQIRELNVTTFKGLEYLSFIKLNFNPISHLSSRAFEYLPNLNNIYLYRVPLHCDCSLQWLSIVNLNFVSVYYLYMRPRCAAPPQHSGKQPTDPSIYVNCIQELSYQCFNRSNSCPTGSYCQDTLDNYTCVCEEENHLFFKIECVNIDRLTTTPPQHTTIPQCTCPTCPTVTCPTCPTVTNPSRNCGETTCKF